MYRHLIPSKSALNAVQTKGAIGLLFLQIFWNACIPNLCKGARFSKIGCPLITFSRISQTTGSFCLLFSSSAPYQFTVLIHLHQFTTDNKVCNNLPNCHNLCSSKF
jgi:hypothetical protein